MREASILEGLELEMTTEALFSRRASATQKPMPEVPPTMRTLAPESLEVYFFASAMMKLRESWESLVVRDLIGKGGIERVVSGMRDFIVWRRQYVCAAEIIVENAEIFKTSCQEQGNPD